MNQWFLIFGDERIRCLLHSIVQEGIRLPVSLRIQQGCICDEQQEALINCALKVLGSFLESLSADESPTTSRAAGAYSTVGVSRRKDFADCRERTPHPRARDEAAAERLWTESAKLVGLAV